MQVANNFLILNLLSKLLLVNDDCQIYERKYHVVFVKPRVSSLSTFMNVLFSIKFVYISQVKL